MSLGLEARNRGTCIFDTCPNPSLSDAGSLDHPPLDVHKKIRRATFECMRNP
jgi:hypothetical protein